MIQIHDEIIDSSLVQALLEIVVRSVQLENKSKIKNKEPITVTSDLINSLNFTSPYLSPKNDQQLTSAQLVAVVYKFIGLLNANISVTEYLPGDHKDKKNLFNN